MTLNQITCTRICLVLILGIVLCGTASAADRLATIAQRTIVPVVTTTATTTAVTCPSPYECMAESAAQNQWGQNGYTKYGDTICGRAAATTAVIPYYCFKQSATTTTTTVAPVACTGSCQCMVRADAVAKWGADNCVLCSQTPCSYTNAATGAQQTQYCFQQNLVTTVTTTTAAPVVSLVTANLSVVAPVTRVTTLLPSVNKTLLKTDTDKDGIIDILDNCPSVANPDQKDSDAITSNCKVQTADNGGGVKCDMTATDNIGDACDNCPKVANADQADADHDGVGDVCDNCPSVANAGQADADNNGVGDACQDPCSMNIYNVAVFSWTNWRGTNWMTSVKNQGDCGACYAESPTGTLEAKYNIEQGSQKNLDTSEQAFVSPCYSSDPGSCLGGSRGDVLNNLKSHGVPEEEVLPFQSGACTHYNNNGDLVCNAGVGAHCSKPNSCNMGTLAPDHVWKITSFGSASGSVNSVKQQLLCKGPLSVCSGKWWHCVVLVGWDNNKNGGSWLIKNSWGTGWESNGYGWIKFSGEDRSEIRNDAQYVTGVYSTGGI